MKALLSTYNKTGLEEFSRSLIDLGYDLVSTGGTHQALATVGIPVKQVADITGFPEILGGRVKTLHPFIHGGILARRQIPDDLSQLAKHGIEPIDLVVSNLYPFREVTRKVGVTLEEALENFAGCAVIISHDRWFLDRVATHILAFEGDSQVLWFEGNYTEYEESRKRRLGAEAEQPHRIKYRQLTRD